jgi:mRNA interferase RelE/StbE
MAYAVTLRASALRQVERLPHSVSRRVLTKASALGVNPRPLGAVKLAGAANLWRVRVGDYRIVYAIDDSGENVDVRIVAHRREVYRDI